MATIEPPTRYKPEDLLKMPNGDRYELVNGQLVAKEMGWEASEIASQLFLLLGGFVRDHQLGRTVVAGSYQCFADAPDKVRKPDVSFIRRERMPADERPKGHNLIVPDLVVEVVSPNDLFSDNENSPQQAAGYQKEMHSDEKPRFLKLFPLSGNPIASYGESVRLKSRWKNIFGPASLSSGWSVRRPGP